MNKEEVLIELDWMIKAAWGELNQDGLSVLHDPALARDLESIRDWVKYSIFSDKLRFDTWCEEKFKFDETTGKFERDGELYDFAGLLKMYRSIYRDIN